MGPDVDDPGRELTVSQMEQLRISDYDAFRAYQREVYSEVIFLTSLVAHQASFKLREWTRAAEFCDLQVRAASGTERKKRFCEDTSRGAEALPLPPRETNEVGLAARCASHG